MATYLDHAATTPARPEAVEAMMPLLTEHYGNPSGAHRMARDARRTLDDARDVIAAAVGADPGEVVFTAGGTESDNLAVFGVTAARPGVAVCPAAEHHGVLEPVEHLEGRIVAVDDRGRVDLDALEAALDDSVSLVSVMAVNNETGVIQPLDEVGEVVRRGAPDALLHTDAVQAFPWLDVAAVTAGADLVSLSAHKFGGPQGVGALVLRNGATIAPQLLGGGQERDRRSGTQNVAGVAAMAAAATATVSERDATNRRVSARRDRLADGLVSAVPGTVETAVSDGDRSAKIPGSCHVCIEGIESEALLFLLEREDLFASAASSCSSGAQDPSHVLAAMGVPRHLAQGSVRLSLGPTTTDADIDHALSVIPPAVEQLRTRGL